MMMVHKAIPDTMPFLFPEVAEDMVDFQVRALVDEMERVKEHVRLGESKWIEMRFRMSQTDGTRQLEYRQTQEPLGIPGFWFCAAFSRPAFSLSK